MTGSGFLALILLSMGWLFFIAGVLVNYRAAGRARGLGPLPGVVGSLTVFFSIPALAARGIELPWPWLWILAPLAIDPRCVAGLVLLVWRK